MAKRKKYSVTEIDRMRVAIGSVYLGPTNPQLIEERLRTYMLNGTEPDELEVAAAEIQAKRAEYTGQFRARPGQVISVSEFGWTL